jgi:hypothetical protein
MKKMGTILSTCNDAGAWVETTGAKGCPYTQGNRMDAIVVD